MSTSTISVARRPATNSIGRRAGVIGLVLAVLTLSATAAWAYWSGTGNGTGSAVTGTLDSPNAVGVSSTAGSGKVDVSWEAPTGGSTPAGYFVSRTSTGGGSPQDVCSSSPSELLTGLSCADTPVPDGQYTYVVTAVLNSWTAQSAPSSTVIVTNTLGTTTSLVSSANPSMVGQTVTYTATVTPTVGSSTPNGTVTFLDGSTPICSAVALTSGQATCTETFVSIGEHSISATYAGNSSYGASSSASLPQNVNQGSQTIAFTSTAPTTATVGGLTYTVSATGGPSGNPVTFASGSPTVCSVAGSTVSFSAVGTCVVNADQDGSVNYAAAPQKQQSFSVGKGSQAITFTSTAPTDARVGGAAYVITATGGASANPVTFSSATTAKCTVSGSTVSFVSAGTCTINANQAGNTNYNAATRAQQNIAVGPGNQAINFTSTAPANAQVGGSTYTVTATGGASGQPVTFSVDSTASAVCSLGADGKTVSFAAVGTCKVNANQVGNTDYNAAPQVQQSFPVAKGSQAIAFTSNAPANAKFGGANYSVTATGGGSGNPVTFSSATTSVCTVSGSTVSFVGAGSCTVEANQAGNGNWEAATPVQQTFAVAKGDQSIIITSSAPSDATAGGNDYTVVATATSGLAVTLASANSAVCTLSGSVVSFIAAGTCTINASQAGDGTWSAATPVQQSFAVGPPPASAPTNIVTTSRGNSISATWTAVAGATSYECQLTSGSAAPAAGSWTPCVSGVTALQGRNQNNKFNVRGVRGGAAGPVGSVSY